MPKRNAMGSGHPDLGINHSPLTLICVTLEKRGCPQSSNMGTLPSLGDCFEDEMSAWHIVSTQEMVDSIVSPSQTLASHLQEGERPPCRQHFLKIS